MYFSFRMNLECYKDVFMVVIVVVVFGFGN